MNKQLHILSQSLSLSLSLSFMFHPARTFDMIKAVQFQQFQPYIFVAYVTTVSATGLAALQRN